MGMEEGMRTSFRMAEAIAPLWEKMPTGPAPGLASLRVIRNHSEYPSSPTKSVSMLVGSYTPMQFGPMMRHWY